MGLAISEKHGYTMLTCQEAIIESDDLRELRNKVSELCSGGTKRIAVELAEGTFLNSMSVGILLQCHMQVDDRDGEFAIIHANREDEDLLDTLNLTCLLKTYASVDELATD
ncbi:MAG: STAS domain-containing protein [Chitinivibrionales bacterium]|nr:STAS domain-containing protein [Chitinivibrionales bacterium]